MVDNHKSAVSALHEYCAKRSLRPPEYEFITAEEDGGFVCMVDADGEVMQAQGRSKRDAKHSAAANLISKFCKLRPDSEPNTTLTQDMVGALRDYCVQRGHPLPTFDLVQQAGTPDSPQFTILCKIASINRYGVSDKKKDARQKAAAEMLRVIIDDGQMRDETQIAPMDAKKEELEDEHFKKIKTYRELTATETNEIPGIRLCNRHNYFTKFFLHLKKEAHKIINSDQEYSTPKAQAMDLLHALKLKHKITYVFSDQSIEPICQFEVLCDYDAIFAGTEDEVFRNIILYFKEML